MKVLLWGLIALLLQLTSVFAHASLNATEPRDGSVLETAPRTYSLTFSEPVSPLSLRLVKPDGTSVALDRIRIDDRTVEVEAPERLGEGTHVLSWRVVSEDGHAIGGSVIFSIGQPSANAPLVQEETDWTVRIALQVTKVALYVGLFFGAGGVFARAVLMPGVAAGRRLACAFLVLGTLGAILSTGLQGLDALDATTVRIGDPVIWSTGLGTSYGRTVAAALLAFSLAGIALLQKGSTMRIAACAAFLLSGAALALSGHASAAHPQWLMRPAVFFHAQAIMAWVGALPPLGLALKRAEPGAGAALHRFSRIIPVFVVLLLATGVVLAFVQVEHPSALPGTAYGRVFLLKLALLAGLFLLAAFNRWWLTKPARSCDPSGTSRLVRSVGMETLFVLLILATASAWRFTPPPRALAAAAALPATLHIHTPAAMADLTITPGRAGPVTVSAIIMTGDFGPLDAREVSFVFANPASGIEPFRHKAMRPGDATWRADGVFLPLPGIWQVRVDVLISDFEMARLEGEFPVRP